MKNNGLSGIQGISKTNRIDGMAHIQDILNTLSAKPVIYAYKIPITSSNWKKTPVVPVARARG